jgi:hypothetical protein
MGCVMAQVATRRWIKLKKLTSREICIAMHWIIDVDSLKYSRREDFGNISNLLRARR